MERKLAAILAADVVGYAALMDRDEAGTFGRLKERRQTLLEPELEKHHGRIFKLMGDGLLAEFGSVVDAVECAVAVQRGMAERNASVPEDERIEVRIGINLGEVIVEGDDRYGEGVNVAARLEQLAEPGGICVSGKVSKEVEKKLAFAFEPMGEQKMKNIAEAIPVYRVKLDGASARRLAKPASGAPRRMIAAAAVLVLIAAGLTGAALWFKPWQPSFEPKLALPDKPSIAVLPFANMSGDPQQAFFADGMTDDLITDLSRVSGLFVISRNSTFAYKDKHVDLRQVAEDLGVRYVLEGSIQRSAGQVRINAQLIDATTGGHVWADRFDGSLTDVFALQTKVTRSIADALAIRLTDAEQQTLGAQETKVPAAYDAFLRAWEHIRQRTPDDYAAAVPYLEQAIKLDPDYGRAYAALAWVYLITANRGWSYSLGIAAPEARTRGLRYLAEAKKRPTTLFHQAEGLRLWDRGEQPAAALEEFKKAIALNSGDALSYAYLSVVLTTSGRPAEGLPHIRTAMRLDPHYPAYYDYILGIAQFGLEQYADAAVSLERATSRNAEDQFPFLLLAATYGHLGRKEAAAALARFNAIIVGRGAAPVTIDTAPMLNLDNYKDMKRLQEGLRSAGIPSSLDSGEFARLNRLKADEIRTLLFGHTLRGRVLWNNEEYAATFTPDGRASFSRPLGSFTDRQGKFDGDKICLEALNVIWFCGSVFRNPGGTKELMNEYIWLDLRGPKTFSIVE